MGDIATTPCSGSPEADPRLPPARALNLVGFGAVETLVKSRVFPAVFQGVTLGIFVSLAVLAYGHYTPDGVNSKLYAKTNLVNLLLWGLWWPAIVWVTFLLGRAWCIICPLELVSAQAEKLGSQLGLPQRPVARWITGGSLVVLSFAMLQMLVPGVQIHRVPHYTALFLFTSLGLALAVGLFLKDRAFCRGFCPVSLLLRAYGRGGMLAVRPAGGDCARAGTTPPDARSCPSLLNPGRLASSKDCLICGDCVKADTSGAMQMILRPLFTKADSRQYNASWPFTLFVMVVSGFVTYELSGVWKAAEPVFLWVPKQVSSALNAGVAAGWIQGLWTLLAVPLALWLVLGVVTLLSGGARTFGEAWRRLAMPMAVVVATGHMAKSLEKFTSWVGFLPYALPSQGRSNRHQHEGQGHAPACSMACAPDTFRRGHGPPGARYPSCYARNAVGRSSLRQSPARSRRFVGLLLLRPCLWLGWVAPIVPTHGSRGKFFQVSLSSGIISRGRAFLWKVVDAIGAFHSPVPGLWLRRGEDPGSTFGCCCCSW